MQAVGAAAQQLVHMCPHATDVIDTFQGLFWLLTKILLASMMLRGTSRRAVFNDLNLMQRSGLVKTQVLRGQMASVWGVILTLNLPKL